MKYHDYQDNGKSFLSLTGYSPQQFLSLLPFFEQAHHDYFSRHDMSGNYRTGSRSFVIYKNSPLPTVEDRLFFIMIYLKNNPLQEYHAACFDMEQKQCNCFIHALFRVIEDCLEDAGAMPVECQNKLVDMLKKHSTGDRPAVLLHDATEREIPRPVDDDLQKEYYSGKKKRHTLKNAVIITAACLILYVSPSVCGKMHDKKIADTAYSLLRHCTLYQDAGYQGFRPPGATIMQPVRKPKGRELTAEEKEYNQKISSFRVRVEHAIGSVKRMRIVKDECRLRANKFPERIFKECAALHNFRIKMEPWRYKN